MDRRTELLELAVALAEAAEAGKAAEDMLIAAAGGLDVREGTSWQMLRWRLERAARSLLMSNPQNTADQRRRAAESVEAFTDVAADVHARQVPAHIGLPDPLFPMPGGFRGWRDRLTADDKQRTAAELHNDVVTVRGDIQRVAVSLKLVIMRLDEATSD